MALVNAELLAERARNLAAANLNGMKLVLVRLQPAGNPTEAVLDLQFHNDLQIAAILGDIGGNPNLAKQIFPISGGLRRIAGGGVGQVQITAVVAGADAQSLRLTVAPIGDYSTYTLHIDYASMDPLFDELEFKFRPGCFSIDCAPEWEAGLPPLPIPAIDYLAKDFDSFKHTMIAAMAERVPGWRPTSEADLDQVLLELFSAAADELSDYQDRVMNEAYLGTARKRVSLARHARLMDYHIHEGNQASAWLALDLPSPIDGTVPAGFTAWTGPETANDDSQVFLTRDAVRVHHLLSRMSLYTWGGVIPSLEAGATEADLQLTGATDLDALAVQDLIRSGAVTRLLIQERLNPATGQVSGRDPTKRQLLTLLPGDEGAERHHDPMGGWYVHVRWAEKDKLQRTYCFTVDCPDGTVTDVSLFHGNLVQAFHGKPTEAVFVEPGMVPPVGGHFFERTGNGTDRWGGLCRLLDGPLAYRATPPGGVVPSRSTLSVSVEPPGGGSEDWAEAPDLVHSDDSAENGSSFTVETDELGRSLLRFGNGVNGRRLPEGAVVHCTYQVGAGFDGNVGPDTIVNLDHGFDPLLTDGTVWNPFDGVDGRAPEARNAIIRAVPEAFRARQLRAVSLADYVARAEELDVVSRAAARYAWTGSWRTVQLTIDPVGKTELDAGDVRKVADYIEAVRLIGEDVEIRSPRLVPLDIRIALCVDLAYWPEDLRFVLEQEFSDGYTPDGRLGFFHPDAWTFGQGLRASQIEGRIQAVTGVEHIISIAVKRWNDKGPAGKAVLDVRANEIISVRNDPDFMEKGFVFFDLQGGRQ
jgi:hypothetical protein